MSAIRTNWNNRRLPTLAVAISLAVTGCGQIGVDPAPAPQPASISPAPLTPTPTPTPAPAPALPPVPAPSTTPPPSSADQQLAAAVAGTSMRGTNPAGDDYCTYYAPDGGLTTVLRGSTPEAGSWSVSNGTVCERSGVGATQCSNFLFQPSLQSVTITPMDGGLGRQITATYASGNSCLGF